MKAINYEGKVNILVDEYNQYNEDGSLYWGTKRVCFVHKENSINSKVETLKLFTEYYKGDRGNVQFKLDIPPTCVVGLKISREIALRLLETATKSYLNTEPIPYKNVVTNQRPVAPMEE